MLQGQPRVAPAGFVTAVMLIRCVMIVYLVSRSSLFIVLACPNTHIIHNPKADKYVIFNKSISQRADTKMRYLLFVFVENPLNHE